MSRNENRNKQSSFWKTLTPIAALINCMVFHQPQPKRTGKIQLHGLAAHVEVLRDKWEVPHIYAQSIEDVFYAQGFIHAQERLFQMDFQRRLVAGRLAEVLGEVAIPADRWMRTITMYRAAQREALHLEGTTKLIFDSYISGVNTFISKGKLPLEFQLLGYQPEPWTSADSISWSKMMAWDLCVNWETEIIRAQLIARLGIEKENLLEPPYLQNWPTIIPKDIDYSCIGKSAMEKAKAARKFTGPEATEGLGSNNWVISGSRTESGMPILANDMHLGMAIPSLWFENHLVGGELNVSGLSFPGIPGIVQGHTPFVAWGFTDGFSDVEDLFIEHLRTSEDGKTQYEYKGKWHEAEVIEEVIHVKDGTDTSEKVVITNHGPIINLLSPDLCGEQPLALCWTGLREISPVDSLFLMNTAKTCAEFRDAMRHWTTPNQNTVYADIYGNIGYSLPGLVPIRAKGDGCVPVPGWTGEYDWIGYIPYDELPHMFNPMRGFIASANNKVVDDSYPYWLGVDVGIGGRISRIEELIQSNDKHSVNDIKKMQVDQLSITARTVIKALSEIKSEDPEVNEVLQKLASWNARLSPQSSEAAVYEVFINTLMNRILKPLLGELTEYYRGKGPTPMIKMSNMLGDHSRMWLSTILNDASSPFWSLDENSSREDHLLDALREAIEYLKVKCGPRFEDWQWGKIHRIAFNHYLGSEKSLSKLLNRGPYPLGGDIDTIWMGHSTLYDLKDGNMVGPQFRFIGDLSDWNNSQGVITPGQSGHPASRHYSDGIQPWLTGQYHPMLFDRDRILGSLSAKLILMP